MSKELEKVFHNIFQKYKNYEYKKYKKRSVLSQKGFSKVNKLRLVCVIHSKLSTEKDAIINVANFDYPIKNKPCREINFDLIEQQVMDHSKKFLKGIHDQEMQCFDDCEFEYIDTYNILYEIIK